LINDSSQREPAGRNREKWGLNGEFLRFTGQSKEKREEKKGRNGE
jgi:hypothetical protein